MHMTDNLGEKYRLAILGICNGIVPLVKRICERRLDRERYEVCYSYEVSCVQHHLYGLLPQEEPSEIEKSILAAEPDILLLCNPPVAFLGIASHAEERRIPVLILAGEKLGFETEYPALYLPDNLKYICPKIEEILAHRKA